MWGAAAPFTFPKQRQLPLPRLRILPNDVGMTIITSQLEVPVIGSEPLVEHLVDYHPSVIESNGARRLLAAIARITFHLDHDVTSHHMPSASISSTLLPHSGATHRDDLRDQYNVVA
jgi:hypothetical protein